MQDVGCVEESKNTAFWKQFRVAHSRPPFNVFAGPVRAFILKFLFKMCTIPLTEAVVSPKAPAIAATKETLLCGAVLNAAKQQSARAPDSLVVFIDRGRKIT